MLRELRIENVAVIREARLQPGSGFTALTGETGAGKSVCVAALRAALGDRVDTSMIRVGAESARVSAVFDDAPGELTERLAELGVPAHDCLTLTRDIAAAGRGSCRINGALVSQALMREIGETLVDVTHQGASQRLLRAQFQRELLDAAGGQTTIRARDSVESAWRAWRIALRELEAAQQAAHADADAINRARTVVEDLAPLQLVVSEEEQLHAERVRLRNATRLAQAAETIADAAAAEDEGAADALAHAVNTASDVVALDPLLEPLIDEASLLVERQRDLARDCRRYAESVHVDAERLAFVEARLDVLARVTRRFGSVASAIAELERAQGLLSTFDDGEAVITARRASLEESERVLRTAASDLSRERSSTARRLERAVIERLRELELPHARFRVVLARTPDSDGIDCGDGYRVRCGAHGVDDVDFRLVTNRDMLPAPLDRASGGELSRLALALSALISAPGGAALVLDEVDTGLGGETAARVGDVLADIGRRRQVIAITHRPEIAARATTHLVVERQHDGGEATLGQVHDDARITEIARLMSGRTTRAALQRAAELLEEGRVSPPSHESPPAAARTI
jgi:DNA repair protein RecN (Recombination protein N)